MPMGGIESPGMALKPPILSGSKPLPPNPANSKQPTSGIGGGTAQVFLFFPLRFFKFNFRLLWISSLGSLALHLFCNAYCLALHVSCDLYSGANHSGGTPVQMNCFVSKAEPLCLKTWDVKQRGKKKAASVLWRIERRWQAVQASSIVTHCCPCMLLMSRALSEDQICLHLHGSWLLKNMHCAGSGSWCNGIACRSRAARRLLQMGH